jgi:hypothetical protein
MTVIKPRTRGRQYVRHRTRLEHNTNETLYAYAEFIGESTEYVLNQLIDTVLAKDKDYVAWRAEHRESCTRRTGRARAGRRGELVAGHDGASGNTSTAGHTRT